MNVCVQVTAQRAAHCVSDHSDDAKERSFQEDRRRGGEEEACGNAHMQQLIQQVTAETSIF